MHTTAIPRSRPTLFRMPRPLAPAPPSPPPSSEWRARPLPRRPLTLPRGWATPFSTTDGGEVVGGSAPRGIPTTAGDAAPGQLLWAQRFRSLDAGQVRAAIGDAGFDASAVRVGVDLWRVVYATTDPSGARVTASGLVAIPRSAATRLTTVLIEHGTLAYRGDAPSVGANPFVLAAPLQAAGAGYLVVSPDYLGLGYGAGTHPYLHIPSEVSASVDLLTATRRLLGRTSRAASGDLLVGGFSQGGPAALGRGSASGSEAARGLAGAGRRADQRAICHRRRADPGDAARRGAGLCGRLLHDLRADGDRQGALGLCQAGRGLPATVCGPGRDALRIERPGARDHRGPFPATSTPSSPHAVWRSSATPPAPSPARWR
jgi:hypothetical protein